MNYSRWLHEQYATGLPIEKIAEDALRGPLLLPGGLQAISGLLTRIGNMLGVHPEDLHVVGSARYGFSMHDGSPFSPTFSDLDLALVAPELYARCSASADIEPGAARFPQLALPEKERMEMTRAFEDISFSASHQFAYVSLAVFPDPSALLRAQAARIHRYLVAGASAGSKRPPRHIFGADLQEIVDAGLPRFLLPVQESNPTNATPWIADEPSFSLAFGRTHARRELLSSLRRSFLMLEKIIEIRCCLIGGSFVNASNPSPRDIDIVLFYSVSPDFELDPGRALQRVTHRFSRERIDMRFVPCDGEPWLLVKLTSFFTTLYQTQRSSTEEKERGLVLLVPTATAQDQSAELSDVRGDRKPISYE